jgi:GNAT superfamily N-acetyltransferase
MRPCTSLDFDTIYRIINEAANAYRGKIPPDCWHEPYMEQSVLQKEMDAGVHFWGWEESGDLAGIMGIQKVLDVTLIRHAYIKPAFQGKGIGGALLDKLSNHSAGTLFVGTWAAAVWAIRLYEHHGFRMVGEEEKNVLLRKYWNISERQLETSVVLAYETSYSGTL